MNSSEQILQRMSELNVSPLTIQDELERLESELIDFFGPGVNLHAET
ncbi:hypothetical protein ACX93W_05485 [Paenibacillus sp. CAU 1782]